MVRMPSGGVRIIEVKLGGTINLGKFGSFNVDGILGFPLGQSFQIEEDKSVVPIHGLISTEVTEKEETPELVLDVIKSSESNQNIVDIGSKIQKLSSEDIEILKKQQGGEDLINKIISSHEGFDLKTKFSQEKYLKRKQQKFLRRFTVEYLGSSQMLHYYLEKDLNKVLDLSEETLGLLTNLADVRPGGKYLVADETGGVVVYAMMERMRGDGLIVLAHENEHPNLIALKYSNYPESLIDSMVKPLNWLQVMEPEEERLTFNEQTELEIENLKPLKREQYHRRKLRVLDINSTIDLCCQGGFDALVYCTTTYPATLVPKLLDKVGGSRPVVVYSQYKEIVLETQHAITKDLRIINPNIFETKMRLYQTILGRVHPLMTMRGGGGYLLWLTRVIPREGGVTAVGRGFVRRNERKRQAEESEETLTKVLKTE